LPAPVSPKRTIFLVDILPIIMSNYSTL